MNMPGFTAAESLYRSRGHYHGRSADSLADSVVPAAPMCGPKCDAILDRCAAGLIKGEICSLCVNCGTPPKPSPGSDDPFGAYGPLWDFDDPRVPPIVRTWDRPPWPPF
jgi:hypothetical protein